jgi:hypothetical protein
MRSVVVVDEDYPQQAREQRKFATNGRDLKHWAAWLDSQGVSLVVMESTALYWRPVWLALEGQYVLHLAQAQSNAAPRGRKSDYVDALRWARRFLAAELRLSFVADAEQRTWRCLARHKHQKRQRRIQIQNQMEALLEECQIKLSSVITDLLGLTGYRILQALAKGETDPSPSGPRGKERYDRFVKSASAAWFWCKIRRIEHREAKVFQLSPSVGAP